MKRVHQMFTLLLLSAALFLNGCARIWPENTPAPGSGLRAATTGGLLGKVLGPETGMASLRTGAIIGVIAGTLLHKYWVRHAEFKDQLMHAGVRIIFVGEDVKIILPMHHFYRAGSTSLEPNQYQLLHRLAAFIRRFSTTSVKFSGYTSQAKSSSAKHRVDFSKARASRLKHFMWRANMDTRLAYATGYGSRFPIASNKTFWGREQNNRIEITFRRIPDAPIS